MHFTLPIRVSAPHPGPIPGAHPVPEPVLRVPRMKPRYSNGRGHVRGNLREEIDDKLREVTGDDDAAMYWTLEDYVQSVVLQHGLKLVGWPPDILFQNLSNIRGGASVLTYLKHRWDVGILKFVPITDDKRLAASLNTEHLAPAPKCAHRKQPGGREDIGRGRYRPKTNPYGRPLRRPKTGPKTPKYVPPEWDD